jgi:hypothetical protein
LAGLASAQQPGAVLTHATPQAATHDPSLPAPLPGEEVMRPTTRGLPFSPNVTRAFAAGWIQQNLREQVDLTPDQVQRLSNTIGARMLEMARRSPQPTQQFFEGLIATAIATEGGRKMTADDARTFAENTRPILPLSHEFFDTLPQDANGILDEEQKKKLQDVVERQHRKVDELAGRLDRWAEGEFKEGDVRRLEDLFEDREPEGESADPKGAAEKTRSREIRQARRMVRNELERTGPQEWRRFISMCKTALKFTPEQSAKADQLLADCRTKAAEVMTPEWKGRLRQNRLRHQLRWSLQKEPTAPWVFHLEREHEQLLAPLRVIETELYAKVLALATDEQRAALLNEIATNAAQHGLTMGEPDRAVLMGALK